MKLLIAALFAAAANAACPNACSGHGRCTNYAAQFSAAPTQVIELPATAGSQIEWGYNTDVEKKDSCTCFSHLGHNGEIVYQFTGPDCSIPTCPHAAAFAGDTLSNDQFNGNAAGDYHTQEVECSGQGTCEKGICKCYPGYQGDACQRTACPNACSNAGKCMTLEQIAEDVQDADAYFYGAYMGNVAVYGTAFDKEQQMGCVCDAGRHGPDCSLYDCPSTTDPMGGPGNKQGRTCSGRGACDETTGTCNCYGGFFGTQCERQRNQQA